MSTFFETNVKILHEYYVQMLRQKKPENFQSCRNEGGMKNYHNQMAHRHTAVKHY